jgi:[ribosomal protein S18]-alanine N-acetyltransferase
MSCAGVMVGACQPGEIRMIASLEQESFPCPWTEEMFRQEASSPLSRILVARAGREGLEPGVVGYLIFWVVADELHLQKIAVKGDLRRRGIASALLAEALCEAAERNCRRATLEVRPSNRPALRFYEKFGFVGEGIRPRYYEDTGEDALILWADLPVPDRQRRSCLDGGTQDD